LEKIGQTAGKRRRLRPAAIALGAAKDLLPGYFALVMATGIVSIAANQEGLPLYPGALLGVNWAAYGILWALTLLRAAAFPREFTGDLSSHQRGAGFFTLAAATGLLGTQTLEIAGAAGAANVLWWIGLGLWFAVMYAFFTAVTIRGRKPPLGSGLSGAWLVAAVATQSIVILRGALDTAAAPIAEIQFLCLALFFAGCFIYLSIIPLILYRLTFLHLSTEDFSPPYWINMGAVAITALAGSTLIQRADDWPVLKEFAPFLKGITLFFWAAGT
jgi:tellurite resistance protein TehA-like permease